MAQIIGSNKADTRSGTQKSDRIEGRQGNDTLYGLGGSDLVFGGDGSDVLYDDFLDVFSTPPAPGGNDQVFGDAGNDLIYLSHGADTASGGAGDDTIRSEGENHDVLAGGAGNDRLMDFSGSDIYRPGQGNDYIVDGHLMITGPDDGADRYQFEKMAGGFGADTILGFDQGYGDRIEFVGYTAGDLMSVTETDRATVFAFKDGSRVMAFQDEMQVLHGLQAGRDYFFTA